MGSTLATPYTWATQLLDVAAASLIPTSGGAITRAFVSAGLPALDCCPQLTVHTAGHGLLPTSAPGALTPGHRRTVGQVRYIRFIITEVRCAPVPGTKGQPPSPASQSAIAEVLNQDALAIIAGVNEAWKGGGLFGGVCKEFYFDGATSLDPSGGCVGWLFNYRASIEGLTLA
jgi:hypothetical protein